MNYQLRNMTQAQTLAFLDEPRLAIVGTSRAGGSPQMVPVWYLFENERVYLSTDVTSAKYRNMTRDPRLCICVAAAHPDARAVIIYGTVEMVLQDVDWTRDINWRLTRRYYNSDEEAKGFIDETPPGANRALCVVTLDKIIGEDWN